MCDDHDIEPADRFSATRPVETINK